MHAQCCPQSVRCGYRPWGIVMTDARLLDIHNTFVTATHDGMLADEVEDDLQCGGLRVLQSRDHYCFSGDSALLANFAVIAPHERVCDLCSGSGVIALLLAVKTRAESVVCVELQPELAERSARSVARNGLADKVQVWCGNAVDCVSVLGVGSMDAVVCNPPYYKVGEGKQKEAPHIAMCRHETHITLAEVVAVAAKLLRFGGRLYMVYCASRLAELFAAMQREGIEPKRLVTVQPVANRQVDTVLVEGKRGGKSGMVVEAAVRAQLEARFLPPVEE